MTGFAVSAPPTRSQHHGGGRYLPALWAPVEADPSEMISRASQYTRQKVWHTSFGRGARGPASLTVPSHKRFWGHADGWAGVAGRTWLSMP